MGRIAIEYVRFLPGAFASHCAFLAVRAVSLRNCSKVPAGFIVGTHSKFAVGSGSHVKQACRGGSLILVLMMMARKDIFFFVGKRGISLNDFVDEATESQNVVVL